MTELESLKNLQKTMSKQMGMVNDQLRKFDHILGEQLKGATPEIMKQYQSIMRKMKDGGASLDEDKVREALTELEAIRDVSKSNS